MLLYDGITIEPINYSYASAAIFLFAELTWNRKKTEIPRNF